MGRLICLTGVEEDDEIFIPELEDEDGGEERKERPSARFSRRAPPKGSFDKRSRGSPRSLVPIFRFYMDDS